MTPPTETINPPGSKRFRDGSVASSTSSATEESRSGAIRGRLIRKAGYPVDTMFVHCWASRAISGEKVQRRIA